MTNIMHTARIKMSNVMLLQSRLRVLYFLLELYNVIQIKIVLLLVAFYDDFSLKNGEKHAFLFKNGLTSCYL